MIIVRHYLQRLVNRMGVLHMIELLLLYYLNGIKMNRFRLFLRRSRFSPGL